jgi:hypothetical protein
MKVLGNLVIPHHGWSAAGRSLLPVSFSPAAIILG